MISIRLPAFIAIIILSGCATTAGYKKIMDSWVGSDETQLVSRWGVPQSVYDLGNGSKVLTYDKRRQFQVGGYQTSTPVRTYHNGSVYGNNGESASYGGTSTTYVKSTTPVQNVEMACITRFTVGYGKVQSVAWEGNDCRAKAE